jgi:hypothetical protein
MADPIELELKRHSRQNERIITLLETLVSLAGGHLDEKPSEPRTPGEIRRDVTAVPRGPIHRRYSEAEMQSVHPHERARYE